MPNKDNTTVTKNGIKRADNKMIIKADIRFIHPYYTFKDEKQTLEKFSPRSSQHEEYKESQ